MVVQLPANGSGSKTRLEHCSKPRKKLNISAHGVSKKLRRVSRMRYHDMRRSLDLTPAAFVFCSVSTYRFDQ